MISFGKNTKIFMKNLLLTGYVLMIFGLINWFSSHLGFSLIENSWIWIVTGLVGGTLILIAKALSIGKEEKMRRWDLNPILSMPLPGIYIIGGKKVIIR